MNPPASDTVAIGTKPAIAHSRLAYRPDIEGLRALAILLVVAAHAKVSWLAGGFIGVDLFFVLSGFLISGLLLEEYRGSGTIQLLDFYARRLRRLLPALLAMLAGTLLAAALLLSPLEQFEQSDAAVAASLWLSNMHFALAEVDYFGPSADSNLFLHTWSLGVEEQFYLAWPALLLLMLGAWRWQGSRRDAASLLPGMVLVFAACLLLSALLTWSKPALAFYLAPSRAWQFALGAIAYLLAARWKQADHAVQARRWLATSLGAGGLLAILAAAIVLDHQVPYPGFWALLPSLGAAAVLGAGSLAPDSGVPRLLALRPMEALGRVSYGWYLWHWPVFLLGATVLAPEPALNRLGMATAALVLAVVSHRLLEKPVRDSAWLAARPLATIIGGLLLMLAMAGVARAWKHQSAHWVMSTGLLRYEMVKRDLPSLYRQEMNCDESYLGATPRICAFGPADASRTALAIGDSVGLQWFPALARYYTRPGWRLLVLTKSSCPMVDEPYFYARIGREYVECAAWRRSVLEALPSVRPDVVLLGSADTYGFTARQWIDGSSRVFAAARAAAPEVLVIRAAPKLPFDGPACLAREEWRPSWLPGARDCSAPASYGQREDVLGWLKEAAGRHPGTRIVDLNPLVCPDGRCAAERGGMIVYRDSMHLSAAFVDSISGAFAESVEKASLPDAGRGEAPAR